LTATKSQENAIAALDWVSHYRQVDSGVWGQLPICLFFG